MGGWRGSGDDLAVSFIVTVAIVLLFSLTGCSQATNTTPAPAHTRTTDTSTCQSPTCYPDPSPPGAPR